LCLRLTAAIALACIASASPRGRGSGRGPAGARRPSISLGSVTTLGLQALGCICQVAYPSSNAPGMGGIIDRTAIALDSLRRFLFPGVFVSGGEIV
jgi:hypothetical protein